MIAKDNLGEETEYREFKKSTSELKESLKSLVAMLNKHEHGEIFFGVRNNGQVIGQNITDKTLREISQSIKVNIVPPVYPEIEKIQCRDRWLVHVKFEGYNRPYTAYGRPYIRVADEDQAMDQDTYADMLRRRLDRSQNWEQRTSDYYINDINLKAFQDYLRRAKESERISFAEEEPRVVLQKLNLLKDDHLTNAGAALFVESDLNEIQMAKYATDERLMFRDIRRYTGSILTLVRKAEQYLIDAMDWRVEIKGMKRIEIPEIPVDALREALINAFAHREIESGQAIDIAVYPSKIEIYSPGTFPRGLTPEMFVQGNQQTRRRNPLITRTLYYSKDMESFATGFKRIQDSCDKAGCKVGYRQDNYGFTVIFYRTPQATPQVAQKDISHLSKEQQLLVFCQEPKSLQEMMHFLHLKDRKNFRKRYLKPLLDEGKLVMTIPEMPRSMHQKYQTKGEDRLK